MVVVIIMLLSLLGTKISPEEFIPPSYVTLIFPIIIFLNTCFVVFWIIARKWHFLISLLTLLLCSTQIAEIDHILDKIKTSGYESLSADEKKKLFEQGKK